MDYEEITLTFIASTENALLLSDGKMQGWIPLQYIKDPPMKWYEYTKNQDYEFEIAVWQLIDKGFI
ncbi:MAG: hypothetical protein FK734_03705 [Asgard group archaeon]|nr:hypothetical protein [Asgard group archaeon]